MISAASAAPTTASPRLIVVTGVQAAGKSTVARRLAASFPRGVHVEADALQRMIVTGGGLPELASVAAGRQRARAEWLAALELPWTTGPVAGHLTRLQLITRQGDGRCGRDTRTRRFLRAAEGHERWNHARRRRAE